MYLKYFRQKRGPLNEKIEIKENKTYTLSFKNQKFILGGKFYYYNSSAEKNISFSSSPEKQLGFMLKKGGIEDFINNVEGEYWGVKINYADGSLRIFGDKLRHLDLYYFYNDRVFILSDNPKVIIDEVGQPPYEKNSLISAMSFYLPRGSTLFKNIKRVKYNEVIKITAKNVSVENLSDKDVNIAEYSGDDLPEYNKIVEKAILSRASDKLNLVFNSGGWDSTLILALLRKNFGKNKVRGITMKVVFSDGSCFNKFEVEKVKKIAKIFGVEIDVIEINYEKRRKGDSYSWSDKEKDDLFYRGIFFAGPAHLSETMNYIREKYGKDAVVLNGDGCDSLHNYGFSQFETLLHDNEQFRLYADKMHSYLFGPSFFKKIKNNTYQNDNVYRIFRSLYADRKFVDAAKLTDERKMYYYLASFLLSDIRIPFRQVECKYVKPPAFKSFEKWLEKEYLEGAVENINEKNLYYYFSSLYANFHFQSPQIKIYGTGLDNVRFPYIDMNLFRFLYRMPENFGRGLEFRPTKFPEKELAKKVFPQKLIDILEAGPHSYLSEIKKINHYDEYWLKGKVYNYLRNKISEKKIRRIFDKNTFYTGMIEDFAAAFKRGQLKNLSALDTKLLIMLAILSVNPNA